MGGVFLYCIEQENMARVSVLFCILLLFFCQYYYGKESTSTKDDIDDADVDDEFDVEELLDLYDMKELKDPKARPCPPGLCGLLTSRRRGLPTESPCGTQSFWGRTHGDKNIKNTLCVE